MDSTENILVNKVGIGIEHLPDIRGSVTITVFRYIFSLHPRRVRLTTPALIVGVREVTMTYSLHPKHSRNIVCVIQDWRIVNIRMVRHIHTSPFEKHTPSAFLRAHRAEVNLTYYSLQDLAVREGDPLAFHLPARYTRYI